MATMPTNGNVNHQDQSTASASSRSQANTESSSLSKDEVGWYFVEQYYTTLSKNPERLHLFYGKHSQLVYGLEAEVANVSVGRQQIQERIKSLDLQDCKVRVSNVDSQASEESIVIQVIGETVNKGGEPKKFVQTFILAKQPSGYFVLNDILRYINDDAEEDAAETTAADEETAPETQAAAEPEASKVEPEAVKPEVEAVEVDATAASKDSEKIAETKEAPAPSTEAASAQPAATKDAVATPAKTESAAATPDPEKVAEEIAEEEVKKPELPKDPSPTPVAPRPAAPAAAEPEKAKEPPKPMTWASRAAAAARPAVALPKPAVPAAATPAARPAAAATAAATPAAATPAAAAPKPAAPAPAAEAPAAQESGNEWQTAGADSKRQNRPQSVVGAPQEDKGTLGYVKFVTEKVKTENLKAHLSSFGELVYFDINRTKNCAFVEFANIAGYTAAAAANPHTVDGEQIYVEPRRPKASAYGGSNYSNRGGSVPGRGRGGFDGNRSGSQGGRGGYGNQGRGGRGGAPRGRGGVSQPTNA
ncbi:hypothetical protein MCOR25_007610 [Pyricularia grisea]|uniref:NTF2 domain-containing protein n=1 Tax=Pyricularia grisea TaxID=148305 RepID=A0A6P8BCN6_PYRGI|nr:uncharacterized protein PgNI_04759 [Pyricularia grisea]KAI6357566.1 hypothetical protein MCOR25_007610 [Pyricularia grisea]TLD13636.1 hypothetical protein PgNI_04759 [Pyricularia grisea]